jgi:hypothetical protein
MNSVEEDKLNNGLLIGVDGVSIRKNISVNVLGIMRLRSSVYDSDNLMYLHN